MTKRFKAVIFDIGGVVLRSPFIAIAEYEKQHSLPPNYLNCSISGRGSDGAWQRFERGELPLLEFYKGFSADLSDTRHGNECYRLYCKKRKEACPPLPEQLSIDGRELFGAMMRTGNAYDQHIKLALARLRASGDYKLIALTNNFSRNSTENPISPEEARFLGWDHEGATPSRLRSLFDDFCDSSELGMRKPEHGFFLKACERNAIRPEEAVFLDDIGDNLKAAKELGMQVIQKGVQIGKTRDAVKELEKLVGLDLTTPAPETSKL